MGRRSTPVIMSSATATALSLCAALRQECNGRVGCHSAGPSCATEHRRSKHSKLTHYGKVQCSVQWAVPPIPRRSQVEATLAAALKRAAMELEVIKKLDAGETTLRCAATPKAVRDMSREGGAVVIGEGPGKIGPSQEDLVLACLTVTVPCLSLPAVSTAPHRANWAARCGARVIECRSLLYAKRSSVAVAVAKQRAKDVRMVTRVQSRQPCGGLTRQPQWSRSGEGRSR